MAQDLIRLHCVRNMKVVSLSRRLRFHWTLQTNIEQVTGMLKPTRIDSSLLFKIKTKSFVIIKQYQKQQQQQQQQKKRFLTQKKISHKTTFFFKVA